MTPASEFPGDGAAGEGFTNVGNAELGMSPELITKYLDAGKGIANHAVLLPDGFRFSTHTTSRDWTDELIAAIRQTYARYTVPIGMEAMSLQGVEWGGSNGGRMPLAKYFAVTIAAREALRAGQLSIDDVARKYALSPKYLQELWDGLNSDNPLPLLRSIRDEWHGCSETNAAELEAQVTGWQHGLWAFSTVGLLGRRGGPTEWLAPVNPVVARQDVRFKLPTDSPARISSCRSR